METKIGYLCDGEKPDCKKMQCYKKVKEEARCHTSDINYAVNFEKSAHGKQHISYRETNSNEEYGIAKNTANEVQIKSMQQEDWIEGQNKKIEHYLWIIFVSMVTAVLTTLSITSIMSWP